ncbi:hypothetical protein J120_02715 [candidate division TM6 bacterium JCVI TM6SC1]|uniref:Uncharacterized protein n=1 Tax=candidate division TM6 bacterium JCVI TM6SC1 TaxID=1306947 RepID=A0A0D2I232_9BACT|nr:hypothetical protein J120_02715 [candidate division TM6 bacterium JCVI TM6SC1]
MKCFKIFVLIASTLAFSSSQSMQYVPKYNTGYPQSFGLIGNFINRFISPIGRVIGRADLYINQSLHRGFEKIGVSNFSTRHAAVTAVTLVGALGIYKLARTLCGYICKSKSEVIKKSDGIQNTDNVQDVGTTVEITDSQKKLNELLITLKKEHAQDEKKFNSDIAYHHVFMNVIETIDTLSVAMPDELEVIILHPEEFNKDLVNFCEYWKTNADQFVSFIKNNDVKSISMIISTMEDKYIDANIAVVRAGSAKDNLKKEFLDKGQFRTILTNLILDKYQITCTL